MLVLSSPLGMCMHKPSRTLENLLLPQIAHSLRVSLRVCFSALKKQCYSMLIQLLYIHNRVALYSEHRTVPLLQENYHIRNVWDLGVPAHPSHRCSTLLQGQRLVGEAGAPAEDKPLMHHRSPGNAQMWKPGGLWSS